MKKAKIYNSFPYFLSFQLLFEFLYLTKKYNVLHIVYVYLIHGNTCFCTNFSDKNIFQLGDRKLVVISLLQNHFCSSSNKNSNSKNIISNIIVCEVSHLFQYQSFHFLKHVNFTPRTCFMVLCPSF